MNPEQIKYQLARIGLATLRSKALRNESIALKARQDHAKNELAEASKVLLERESLADIEIVLNQL